MFHDGDLQSGISLAVQSQRAVLCFVHDDTETSKRWEEILYEDEVNGHVTSETVALRLKAGSPEAGFLSGISSLNSTPAIIVIKNAAVQADLQSAQVRTDELVGRLLHTFGVQLPATAPTAETHAAEPLTAPSSNSTELQETHLGYLDLQPGSPGRFRLPNNAYDALRVHTQTMLDAGEAPHQILESQLALLGRLPIFRDEVKRLRSSPSPRLSESAHDRLLRVPAAGIKVSAKPTQAPATSVSEPAVTATLSAGVAETSSNSRPAASAPITEASNQTAEPLTPSIEVVTQSAEAIEKATRQRSEYIQMRREREQSQRDERERIQAHIKADREERRHRDQVQKMNDAGIASTNSNTSTRQKTSDIRLQVRTFDGSTLRKTFPQTATLAGEVRPWIDESSDTNMPYNLKLILTPLPNKNIEAAEEEQSLPDLGIRGSCTLVMVPVKGYVESYTGSTAGGLVGSAVSGGYNLVTGTAGAVFGGVRSMLGYGQPQAESSSEAAPSDPNANASKNAQGSMRVRTLADQRAEERGKDHQFYNGNALNFQPNKDDDENKKVD